MAPAHAMDPKTHEPTGNFQHFQLHFHAAIYYLANYLYHLRSGERDGLSRTVESFPFLGRYLAAAQHHLPDKGAWDATLRWWEQTLSQPSEEDREYKAGVPFYRAFDTPRERIALALIGLVEEDARFGTLFAAIQEPKSTRRPTLGLIQSVLGAAQTTLGEAADEGTLSRDVCRRLIESGLVDVVDARLPRSEWELYVPNPVWSALRGESLPQNAGGYYFVPHAALPEPTDLVHSSEVKERLERMVEALRHGTSNVLIVRGTPWSDRLEVMGAVAKGLGLNVLRIDHAALGKTDATPSNGTQGSKITQLAALARLTGSLPVFVIEGVPGERWVLPRRPWYGGPIGVVTDRYGGVALEEDAFDRSGGVMGPHETALTLTLSHPTPQERERVWTQALAGYDVPQIKEMSERFRLSVGGIRHAAATAAAQAEMEGRTRVTPEDVRLAVHHLGREGLDTLATPLEAAGAWGDLVVTDAVDARLKEVQGRCLYRERLHEFLGPAFGTNPTRGVRVLFSGPSGTGKTLAAKILAAELGMDLYQVDLAAVVNKYIGETEKNLHRVLTTAEELDVILLLDEGDALLARRSEVRGANDRYANLETNFLLQRLETYEGIVVITTNAPHNIDPAFERRMDVVVPFSMPDAPQRRTLWRLHLPPRHRVSDGFLDELARRCVLSGGQIRNACQYAALVALQEGRFITEEHLEAAVRSEYLKAGGLSPKNRETTLRAATDASEPGPGALAFLHAVRGQDADAPSKERRRASR